MSDRQPTGKFLRSLLTADVLLRLAAVVLAVLIVIRALFAGAAGFWSVVLVLASAAALWALVRLVDRLPALVDSLDQTVIPVLTSLEGVGTDVHDLVDTMQDLRHVVKGFPGSKLFRRRGAEEIAENDGGRDDGDRDDEEAQERVGS